MVNTASMAGMVGMKGLGIYCASKFAVVGLSESLYRDLHDRDIGVSVLCPMIVDTPIGEHSREMLGGGPASPPAGVPMTGGVIPAEEVGRRVLRAIERRDLYVFTHTEQREILCRRAARQDAMFAPESWTD